MTFYKWLITNHRLTALGSRERVPYDHPHVLIAGTSCIAFSSLSSDKRKGFDRVATAELQKYLKDMENGLQPDRRKISDLLTEIVETTGKDTSESDLTFFPVLAFILNQRPSIVIFENVYDAPWDDLCKYYCPAIGYSARYLPCDTKDYYLPQTRKRKYLVAFDMDNFGEDMSSIMANRTVDFLGRLQRRASVDVEKFLYNNMDKAIQLDMQQMEFEISSKAIKDATWAFSRQRHENVRSQEDLGRGHPFSGLQSTGDMSVYDRMNKTVFGRQTDRIKDLSDINLLRGLKGSPSFDCRFKVKINDFSQNVDRDLGNSPFGMSGCLTPKGMAFISNQCRLIMGREYLLLQGLPVGTLCLSRETYDQLKNLAGNAMTTTVVAATFISSIMAVHEKAPKLMFRAIDPDDENFTGPCSVLPNPSIVANPLQSVAGFDTRKFDEATTDVILNLTRRLRAYCFCTGTAMYSSAILWRCTVCGTIRCGSCKGNPKHEFEKWDFMPEAFGQEAATLRLIKHLPHVFTGMFPDSLSRRLVEQFDKVPFHKVLGWNEPITNAFSNALKKAVFSYDRVHLSETISICYISERGFTLKIMIDSDSVSWYLFLDAHSSLGKALVPQDGEKPSASPMGSRLRDFCLRGRPFALAKLKDRKLSCIPSSGHWAPWNFAQPNRIKNGLQVHDLRVSMRVLRDRSIAIERVLDDYAASLEVRGIIQSVLGRWIHKPNCDVAEQSLYVLQNAGDRKLFLFKDPSRTGDAVMDTFVISENPRLIQWHEHREVIMKFVPLKVDSKQIHKLKSDVHIQKITMDGYWDKPRV